MNRNVKVSDYLREKIAEIGCHRDAIKEAEEDCGRASKKLIRAKVKLDEYIDDIDCKRAYFDLNESLCRAGLHYVFTYSRAWCKEEYGLYGDESAMRVVTYDYGYMSGGSRGELGDSDPEPEVWIPQLCTFLVNRTVPTAKLKEQILKANPDEAGRRISELEDMWNKSEEFNGQITDSMGLRLFPANDQMASLMGIQRGLLAHIVSKVK